MFRSTYLYSFFTNGDTDLHQIVRQANTFAEIQQFLKNRSPIKLKKMGQTVNHYGYLPIELIASSKLSQNDKILAEEELFKINLSCDYLSLEKEMNADNSIRIAGSYTTQHNNSVLLPDLLRATKVRAFIKKSHAHPDANDYSANTLNKLDLQMKNQEEQLTIKKKLFQEFISSNKKKHLNYEEIFADYILKEIANMARNERTGDCFSIACLIYCKMRKKHPELPMKIIYCQQAKRTFLVILEDKNKNHLDPNNWHILCDAFSGKILLGNKKLEHLKLLKIYHSLTGQAFICQVNYNPQHHTFAEFISLPKKIIKIPNSDLSSIAKIGLYWGAGLLFYASAYKLMHGQDELNNTENNYHRLLG